jgi:gamma-glutamyltranspeptidase/glutathione hydrolase
MWCPARGCEFESRALRFENSADIRITVLSVEMPRQTIANSAAVATGHPLGAAAGLEILQAGGNAIDAAVATMLAMCVVVPGSVGLGGYGGSAVIHIARTGQTVAVDFDSLAPLAYREGRVTADKHSNYYGARSVTVPAVVAGLDLILRDFGSKSWREASQPAIRLADEGFEFDAEHSRHFARCEPHFDRQSVSSLFPGGAVPNVGDRWTQPDLASLLRQLSDDGPMAFYDGRIAESVVGYIQDRGGILSMEDFCTYRPRIDAPVQANCRDFTLHTPPPPSGGITSLAIVQTIEQFRQEGLPPWEAAYFHILAESTKTCWQERHSMLGDPDFISIELDRLVSTEAAESRAQQIRGREINRLGQTTEQSPHTANVIAIDGQGNMISLTATQGWMYGSHLVVDGLGLVLNHGMSRFDYSPGHPNAPAPGKRMQHNMAPMIALHDGRPAFAFGLPGGPKIVSVTAQLALNTIAFGATPAAAITAPRLHTEGDEPLLVSHDMDANVIADLEKRGHTIRREDDMGGPVNVLASDPQTGKIDIASGESIGAVAGF